MKDESIVLEVTFQGKGSQHNVRILCFRQEIWTPKTHFFFFLITLQNPILLSKHPRETTKTKKKKTTLIVWSWLSLLRIENTSEERPTSYHRCEEVGSSLFIVRFRRLLAKSSEGNHTKSVNKDQQTQWIIVQSTWFT